MKSLAIIETGRPPEKIVADWPLYPAMFESLLSPHLGGWTYRSIALSTGQPLPDPTTLDAILITGSPAGVYDETPWMTSLMDFIRWGSSERVPQIGVCFGHQAIAHALGAKVAKSDKGWGIGRHTYQIFSEQSWMGSTPPETFSLGVSHQDQVLSLPPGAIHVGGNQFCEYAALAYPQHNAISFQGHPEYSPEFSCALYGVRKGGALAIDHVEQAEQSFEDPIDNQLVASWIAQFLTTNTR